MRRHLCFRTDGRRNMRRLSNEKCLLFLENSMNDTRRCGGMVDTRDLKSLAGNRVPVRVRSPAPEKGKSEQDFPFSGATPSARVDPLRSNAKEDSRPLSRSSHADLKVGSDLDCPGAP